MGTYYQAGKKRLPTTLPKLWKRGDQKKCRQNVGKMELGHTHVRDFSYEI